MKTAQKFILTAALLSMMLLVTLVPDDLEAGEASGKCGDDLTWSLDETTGTLTITGTGKMYDYKIDSPSFDGYKEAIRTVIMDDGVTSIGDYAFYYCESLASITIPEHVTSIGISAFQYCESLASITIPESVTAINDRAFDGCSSLASITVPDSVTSISGGAFEKCTSLTSVSIPESVTGIGDSAFRECTSLASIAIPNSVKSIGIYAFYGCTSLASITVPDSVTFIDGQVFRGCTSLTSIDIGNCSGIDADAFPDHTFFSEDGVTPITVGSDGFIGHKFRGEVITKMIRNDNPDVTHHVTYNTDGGYGPVPTQADVEEGKCFIVASYSGTKPGYTFGGWSYEGKTYKAGDEVTMGNSDIVLTAIWKEDSGNPGSNGDQTVLIAVAVVVLVALAAVAYWFVRHK